jgi:hypothetical protein
VARNSLEDLDLFAVFALDHVADVVIAAVAAAGALQAGVVGFDGVVGAAARRVEGISCWRYPYLVHSSSFSGCGPGPGAWATPAGPQIYLLTVSYVQGLNTREVVNIGAAVVLGVLAGPHGRSRANGVVDDLRVRLGLV